MRLGGSGRGCDGPYFDGAVGRTGGEDDAVLRSGFI